MPSKQNNSYKKAFDTIVFLGFVALMSVAATKASAWEQEFCKVQPVIEKASMKQGVVDAEIVLSARGVRTR